MSVVVGCTSCGKLAQVPLDRAGSKCRCGQPRKLLLTTVENEERWQRGVTLEAWFDAPKTPASRNDCADGARPCAYLRCKHQLGAPGGFGCELDVSEAGAHTYAQIAVAIGADPSNDGESVRQMVEQAYERTRARFPAASRRELVAVLAALLAA